MRALIRALAMTLAVSLPALAGEPPVTGLQRDVVFTDFPAYARNGELLRRLVSPLNAQRLLQRLTPTAVRAQPLDPARQSFVLYVPSGPPPTSGYALLVFVPPWDDAHVPTQWIPVLDRWHTIFVSAAQSGNDADVLNRREPLALLAAHGVMRRYHVDPAHVYIGGFSGGSRIAMRLALGYPDVFKGAVLDAGSDSIGTAELPLPPVELLHQFQQSSRIVFLTGSDDHGPNGDVSAILRPDTQESPIPKDLYEKERQGFGLMTIKGENGTNQFQNPTLSSQHSLREWCMENFDVDTLRGVGHVLADPSALDFALRHLDAPAQPDADKLSACRTKVDDQLNTRLQQVQALLDDRKRDKAQALLEKIDAQYGGLAAPRSIALMKTLEAAH